MKVWQFQSQRGSIEQGLVINRYAPQAALGAAAPLLRRATGDPSYRVGRDAQFQCIPVFFGATRTVARLFFNTSLVSVSHQFLDFIPVKTVVSADPKSQHQTVACLSAKRSSSTVQIAVYFGTSQVSTEPC